MRVYHRIAWLAAGALVIGLGLIAGQADGQWVAYNDCIRVLAGDNTSANATDWSIHRDIASDYPDHDHTSGRLKDFETGSEAGMPTVTFTSVSTLRVSTGSGGVDCLQVGTDAHDVFYGKVDFDNRLVYYGDAGWSVDITFTGLDPRKSYSFAGFARRANNYSDRISQFTLMGASYFVNNSSDGIYEKNGAVTKLIAGDNQFTGYVVRWDEITVADDGNGTGSFTVRGEAATDLGQSNAYPLGGFMLEAVGGTSNRPPIVDAGEDQTIFWSNVTATTAQLAGIVTDDDPCGLGQLEIVWDKLSGPGGNVLFDNVNDPCTVAIFPGPGKYELQLAARDELDQTDFDTVTITVVEPVCPEGDLNDDCRVGLDDILIMAGLWLDPSGGAFNLAGGEEIDFEDYGVLAGNWLENWSGSLQVTITPPQAVQAGARWRIAGGSWLSSGSVLNDLPGGPYTVEFNPISNWLIPADQEVEIVKGQTTTLDGVYTEMPDSAVLINELMAINSYIPFVNPSNLSTRTEGLTVYKDWIELHNTNTDTISLAGWYLTDDRSNLTKWQFPSGVSIAGKGYLIVYASNKTPEEFPGNFPYVDDLGNPHTNFELSGGGEYLALVGLDGTSVLHDYDPEYPEQRGLISYGLAENGGYGYLVTPTRGGANSVKYAGVVGDTRFSVKRGFYDTPFAVSISCATSDAVIRYTTDGSEPTLSNGQTYNWPISISTTTCLRAAAFKTDWLESNVDTQTYIFLNDVLTQSAPAGYASSWGGYPADYEMDPEVYNDPAYSSQMRDVLLSIPTISLSLNKDHIFASSAGIYLNTGSTGINWERPVSAELFTQDGSEEFNINCGLRLQGGASRQPNKSPKHSLSLRFRGGYGDSKLNYDLFKESKVKSLDSLHLRAFYNNSWIHGFDVNQRYRAQYTRDQWMRDSMIAMGTRAGGEGIFVHLYINGIYWGVHNLHERPEASHYAAHNGGNSDFIDATNGGAVVDGTSTAWNEMKNIVASRDWDAIQQVLDVDNYIDWTIIQRFGSNNDLKGNGNWKAAGGGRERLPWQIYCWDSERVMEGINEGAPGGTTDPPGLMGSLDDIEEFVVRFGDRIHKHFFNGGALTPTQTAGRFIARSNEIDMAIIAESARWGDYRRDTSVWEEPAYLYTRNDFWIPERDRILDDYLPYRTDIVLNQYRGLNLYPGVDAARFGRHGGDVAEGFQLSMTNTNGSGTIYYTTNGADPRLPGGGINNADASSYSGPVTLDYSVIVKARVYSGGNWSALNEAAFAVGTILNDLRISEIMYHPADPPVGSGYTDDDFEYIELTNVGPDAINLNLVRFANGVDYTFPDMPLGAGEYVVVVKNRAAFSTRYDTSNMNIAPGDYLGSLSNSGEGIDLEDSIGREILDFKYKDGWYDITDGEGYSLTIIDAGHPDPCSWDVNASWRPSSLTGGTPGAGDGGNVPLPGSVVVNEVLAHSHAAAADWIELYNATDEDINIGGWYLSDSEASDPCSMKYEITAGTVIGAGDYLVFYEDEHFGRLSGDPGRRAAFALSENGEAVHLRSGQGGVLTGYHEQESFGPSATGVAFGRYYKSSTDSFNFVAMSENTPEQPNAYPKVGPIVITEIMYNPPTSNQNQEYVELYNISDAPVTLQETDNLTGLDVPWAFTDGIDYTFPLGTTIQPGKYLLLAKDEGAFLARYGAMPWDVLILDGYDGQLSNGGERLQLGLPGDEDPITGQRYYIRVERVNYSDGSHPVGGDPWPMAPDGDGSSLRRRKSGEYGNDVANWMAFGPTPGG